MLKSISRHLAFVGVITLAAASASAQNAATALYTPMPQGKAYEFKTDGWWQSQGDSEQTGLDTRLSSHHAIGRFLMDPADRQSPEFAVSWNQLDIHSDDPALPDDDLVDVSVAGSIARPLDDGWLLQLTAGGGFAGDNAFADGSAYYGLANITAIKQLDDDSGYMLILDYNGNRSILPDIPLPGFVYYSRLNENVKYSVGLPSSITWTPDDVTSARAVLTPGGFAGSIEHELNAWITLYGRYDNRTRSFHLDSDDSNRRLFFRQTRVEGGVVWTGMQGDSLPGAEIRVAVGYAFDQEFSRGWDTRDDDTVRDISDEPYIRAALTMRF